LLLRINFTVNDIFNVLQAYVMVYVKVYDDNIDYIIFVKIG